MKTVVQNFIKKNKKMQIFIDGVWHNNPIFGMMLGLCSTLAVTNLMSNALVMSIAVSVVLIANSMIISSIRRIIPEKVRMVAYMLIVSTLVITVDLILKIYTPDASKALGPYVALIITNCIIMGRAEAFAINRTVYESAVDGLGVGVGYTFSLMVIATFREFLGFGTLFGVAITKDFLPPMSLLTVPPGAFFMLGVFILVINIIRKVNKGES